MNSGECKNPNRITKECSMAYRMTLCGQKSGERIQMKIRNMLQKECVMTIRVTAQNVKLK